MSKRRRRMSFRDAMDLVPDDLPDGAFFAMAHEMAGIEYGEGFSEMLDDENATATIPGVSLAPLPKGAPFSTKKWLCDCGKRFRTPRAALQHRNDKHGDQS